ncbi:M23 family metallopeptidase [Leucobacter sp. GX0328]
MLGRIPLLGALCALLVLTPVQPAAEPEETAAALPVASLAASARERWAPPLARPVDVSGPYRAPPHKYGSGHRGIDLPARPGETVIAPASGEVAFAGTVVDRGTVTVRIDDRTLVSIEPVTDALAAGSEVRRGARLATVSSGGHCAAECVHVGVRIEGEYVNPMRFFAGRPVLLPWE